MNTINTRGYLEKEKYSVHKPRIPGQSLARTARFITKPFRTLAILALVLAAPLQANAMVMSLSPADIQAFSQINSPGGSFTFKTSESAMGASYTTVWGFSASGAQFTDIGRTDLNYDWTGFDTFSLNIANNNESSWSFMVTVADSAGSMTSAVQSLPNSGIPSAFSVDLSSLNVAAITSVLVTISEILPINGVDRTAEYAITTMPVSVAVPVPAATWLFSSALGLLVWIKRRQLPAAVTK